jgi:hypothetical protein
MARPNRKHWRVEGVGGFKVQPTRQRTTTQRLSFIYTHPPYHNAMREYRASCFNSKSDSWSVIAAEEIAIFIFWLFLHFLVFFFMFSHSSFRWFAFVVFVLLFGITKSFDGIDALEFKLYNKRNND